MGARRSTTIVLNNTPGTKLIPASDNPHDFTVLPGGIINKSRGDTYAKGSCKNCGIACKVYSKNPSVFEVVQKPHYKHDVMKQCVLLKTEAARRKRYKK